jgi:DNA repair protein RecN (Recombination protein N)
MLRRLSLKDFVIVAALDVDFDAGFTLLTGETGAGKSILIDALQLALGSRGDAGLVREGAVRADIAAELDTPASLRPWLQDAGFDEADSLLLRRTIDTQGKSRAWINGSAATITQLREAADHLLDIHGQHAWQSLTRPPAVRALLDAQAGVDATALQTLWSGWRNAVQALERAQTQAQDIERERERLAWQVSEVARLAPGTDEWPTLNADHQRAAHAQALIDAAQTALNACAEADSNAASLAQRAADALAQVAEHDARLVPVIEVLASAQAQLSDAAHSLHGYLQHAEVDPAQLAALDERLAGWIGLARRFRLPPDQLASTLTQWQVQLAQLDAATDVAALEQAVAAAHKRWHAEAERVSRLRRTAAPKLAAAVTQAIQQLGMAGGQFDVALLAQTEPQSFGLESAEFLVAGHAGSTPRPLAKVASGGELSRLALAIAVTTARHQTDGVATLIFDEIDAGVGGAVADTVGRLMKQLGRDKQVLAITHLAQVAACGDHHLVVSKATTQQGATQSGVHAVLGEARVAEVARMMGGARGSAGLAHAQELLATATAESGKPNKSNARKA